MGSQSELMGSTSMMVPPLLNLETPSDFRGKWVVLSLLQFLVACTKIP